MELISKMELSNWIIKFDSNKKWKIVTLVACTHWDEKIWYEVFKFLIENFNIKDKLKLWKLNLVIGNLKWLKLWKKYIDTDLNRIWDFNDEKKETYEYKRAKEIEKILIESDFVLDLHSTTNPSPSFLIPNWEINKFFLESFNCEYIINNISDFLHWKPLIKYVSEKNNKSKSMVIECFWKNNTDKEIYINNVINFLNKTSIINEELPFKIKKNKPKNYKVEKAIYAESMDVDFKYSSKPKSFDKIKKWSLILTDWNKKIYAESDLLILMPTKPRYIWEEIMYILKKS